MAITTKVRTEYEGNIGVGEDLILEFFDDVAILIITFEYLNGASNTEVFSSTNKKDTLNEISGAVPVWIPWIYGIVSSNGQYVCRCPNALKITNSGSNIIRVSIRGNLRG